MSARYRAAVDAAAIFSETDKSGIITYVNEQFCDISGYSAQELIGQNHRILNSGQHPPEFFIDMWKKVSRGQVWKGEICNRKKDGSLYWVESTIVPMYDDASRMLDAFGPNGHGGRKTVSVQRFHSDLRHGSRND